MATGQQRTKKRRRLPWLVLVAVLVATTSTVYAFHDSWAVGMIVAASSPEYRPLPTLPREVSQAIEIERQGARVRAWLFDPEREPIGTMILIHGIHDSKQSLFGSALRYTYAGFRVMTVDLRGHGESSGRFLTYGVEEARDILALVDRLQEQDLLVEPLGVIGHSYGAATAIQFAAIDPRVRGVVAVASFASLREVVPAYVNWMLGWGAGALSDDWVDEVVDQAAQEANFNPDAACPRCAAANMEARLLVVHSRDDERIPSAHAESIARANANSRLLLVDGPGHNQTLGAPEVQNAIDRWIQDELLPTTAGIGAEH